MTKNFVNGNTITLLQIETLEYYLSTCSSCLVILSTDKHEANFAPGHPKSKF